MKKVVPMFAIALLTACGSGSDSTRGNAPAALSEPPIQITAQQLFKDYDANEVAADNKYKGGQLLVTGRLDSINKDFMDDVFLLLRTSNQFMSVHASLKDSEAQKASFLAKGVAVTVLCEGAGMVVGSPLLNDCVMQ